MGPAGPARPADELEALAATSARRPGPVRPPVPRPVLAQWYRAADLILVPSHSESFGLVALEAEACGTPVVAADVGGLPTLSATRASRRGPRDRRLDRRRRGLLVDTPTIGRRASTTRPRCARPALVWQAIHDHRPPSRGVCGVPRRHPRRPGGPASPAASRAPPAGPVSDHPATDPEATARGIPRRRRPRVGAGGRDGEYVVTLPGEKKLQDRRVPARPTRSTSVSAFVVRNPDENHEEFYRHLLRRTCDSPASPTRSTPTATSTSRARSHGGARRRVPRPALRRRPRRERRGLQRAAGPRLPRLDEEGVGLAHLAGESTRNLDAFRHLLEDQAARATSLG